MVYSDNDGKTWCKEYVNVTEQVKQEEWTCILSGSGNGICTRKGVIVFPAQSGTSMLLMSCARTPTPTQILPRRVQITRLA